MFRYWQCAENVVKLDKKRKNVVFVKKMLCFLFQARYKLVERITSDTTAASLVPTATVMLVSVFKREAGSQCYAPLFLFGVNSYDSLINTVSLE